MSGYGPAMNLRIVGAGLPRTGTSSLREALQLLTEQDCYHMEAVMDRIDPDLRLWNEVLAGRTEALDEVLADFGSAVDWPASSFWPELMDRHPDAIVLLSRRADAATWWKSVDQTVWEAMRQPLGWEDWDNMVSGLAERLGVTDFHDASVGIAAYEAHNQRVRDAVPADCLLEWQPNDGWEPLCAALGVAVPDVPFPRRNNTAEFRAQAGWD